LQLTPLPHCPPFIVVFLFFHRFLLFTLLFAIFVVYPLFIFIVFLSVDKIIQLLALRIHLESFFATLHPTTIKSARSSGLTIFVV
jgi:hypothetical protein